MQLEALAAVVEEFKAKIPAIYKKDLRDVEIMCALTVEHARKKIFEMLGPPEEGEADMSASVPDDCRGIFLGEPMERDAPEDEPDAEEVMLPEGFIILIAGNIPDAEEAAIVLLHETGHALGMSETDVAALGLGGVPSVEASKPQ